LNRRRAPSGNTAPVATRATPVPHCRPSFGVLAILIVLLAFSLVFAAAACGESPRPSTQVDTNSGLVEGEFVEAASGRQVLSFKGIPYAAPPVGDLRFRPPQPVEPWTDVRPCLSFGPSCPQPTGGVMGLLGVGETDEDCLYLNVWTPTYSPSTPLPVMVWIHGGSYVTGSGAIPFYNGRHLAARDVVAVTINYRLGPLGFLAHPALSRESPEDISGNYGIMDQIAALEWVRDNIAAFGGDPANVTVFGESAGAMSVYHLMVSPAARGLFHKAIAQSGALLDRGFEVKTTQPLEAALRAGERMAEALGLSGLSPEEMAQRLRLVPAEDLLEATPAIELFAEGLTYTPVIDGVLIPDEPTTLLEEGDFNVVPLLAGSNRDEGATFTQGLELSLQEYGDITQGIADAGFADELTDLYPASRADEAQNALSRMLTEVGFASSAWYVAQSVAAQGVPAHLYEFTYVPLRNPLGAFHGAEIPYVFGTHSTEEGYDMQLSELLIGYWTRFAATGDPNGDGEPVWPFFETVDGAYMEFGEAVRPASRLYPEAIDLAQRIRGLRP